MNLIAQITADLLKARKERTDTVKIALLTTLVSEANKIGFDDGKRDTTDEECFATIKKFIKNINEFKDKTSDAIVLEKLNKEYDILMAYLPSQLSESELTAIIQEQIKEGMTNKGLIMKFLKSTHDGKYDGKTTASLIDALLKA